MSPAGRIQHMHADQSDADRLAAATQFVELQKSDSASTKLLDLITPRTSPELARGLDGKTPRRVVVVPNRIVNVVV